MEKVKSKPAIAANNHKGNAVLSGVEALHFSMLDKTEPALGEQVIKQDSEQSLDLMRNILFGEQARAAEQQQLALERRLQGALDSLDKKTQQQLNALQHELKELTQKTEVWRQEILRQVEQTGQQLQQGKVDRTVMAALLQDMAQQLSVPPLLTKSD